MSAKTITFDTEAYALLARAKGEGESFSQVIKKHFGGAKTGRDLLEVLARVQLSDETIDAIEEQVAMRQSSAAIAPRL